MVNFEDIHLTEEVPIYLQLIRHVKRGIAAGQIRAGDEMPSRRMLSALLGVNPNTIQKAYRFLEDEGIIESHSGAKSYVMADEEKRSQIRRELLHYEVAQTVQTLKIMHMEKREAMDLFGQVWEEET